MLKRSIAWIALLAGWGLLVLAALLVRPPDVYELLLGMVAGSLLTVQLVLLAIAGGLVGFALYFWPRPYPRGMRAAGLLGALTALIVAGASLLRDRRGVSTETVTLAARAASLEGTIYRPRGVTGALPGILILHGSGPIRRTGYDLFARRFAEHGFIVLNMDKRGVGGSEGRYRGDDLADSVVEYRALDARPALSLLAAQPDVDTARIGVFAISQGGWVVPLLLGGDTPARFGVLFSGVAVSSKEEGRWSDWTNEDADHFGFKPPPVPFEELDRRIRKIAPGDFDPRTALGGMTSPSLWLFGEWDSSAPTAASLRVIDTLQGAGIDITARVFAEANHGLFVVRGPRGTRNADFAPGVWDSVFAWTDRQRITRPIQQGTVRATRE